MSLEDKKYNQHQIPLKITQVKLQAISIESKGAVEKLGKAKKSLITLKFEGAVEGI